MPQRTWELRGTIDQPMLGDGLVKLDLGYDQISMLQDRILISTARRLRARRATSAPASGSFASLTLDAPLQRFGLNGTRLQFDGQLQRTRVDDPISGETRNFSDFFPDWNWNVELRRDAGDFSYGFAINDRDRFTFFRTDEFDTNFNGGPYGTAFVEYRPGPRTSITFDIDNAFDTNGQRDRAVLLPQPARTGPRRRRVPRAQPPPQLRPDLEADLRRRRGGVAKSAS